jgi:hypothetical protein
MFVQKGVINPITDMPYDGGLIFSTFITVFIGIAGIAQLFPNLQAVVDG